MADTAKNKTQFDLLIQAPKMTPMKKDEWLLNAQAESWEEIQAIPPVYRLHNPVTPQNVAAEIYQAGFDVALVPRSRRLEQVSILAMDMDSTLITIECVDEIADMIGIKKQVAEITEKAMRGEIDFRQSLIARVALLKGVPETALEAVYATRLNLSPGAETMLRVFQEANVKTLLVSGGFTFFTERLRRRLKLTQTAANQLEVVDGKLTGRIIGDIVDAKAKAKELQSMKTRFATEQCPLTVAIGDGANDLPMFTVADISFAYHAKPKVRDQATHTIDHCGLEAIQYHFY
ncbi:MAG: phosphoserine phosphatase SerB [Burkholderiales bacterium]|jgi:phosphoserine phosphatase|nr:phosphoserine phosphatase SerB [Burkholderiales bacterium]